MMGFGLGKAHDKNRTGHWNQSQAVTCLGQILTASEHWGTNRDAGIKQIPDQLTVRWVWGLQCPVEQQGEFQIADFWFPFQCFSWFVIFMTF